MTLLNRKLSISSNKSKSHGERSESESEEMENISNHQKKHKDHNISTFYQVLSETTRIEPKTKKNARNPSKERKKSLKKKRIKSFLLLCGCFVI